jgi:hypothetical protein
VWNTTRLNKLGTCSVDLLRKEKKETSGVSHCRGVAIYIKKYLKAKERRIMKTQMFHHVEI